MDFADWMKSTGLSEASVNNYLGAIKGRLTNWAFNQSLTSKRIVEIFDMSEFCDLVVKLKETPEYRTWNVTGHGMYGAALNNYQKYLHALTINHNTKSEEYGPHQKQVELIQYELGEQFNPKEQGDARARVLREVVQRQGRWKFRQSLIAAYGGRCAITGCSVVPLLEAAHITPYLGPDTNSITNGLLLRADLHTLWDLGLFALDPETQIVWMSPAVNDSGYQDLSKKSLTKPAHPDQRPSIAALQQQWDLVRKLHVEAG